ncbi:MAG: GTP-binding protein [Sandaracinaceae bacterium]
MAIPVTPIPVTVITGFLGAGKSTLVERWVRERPRDETAVIVNERGDVGIDGALLASHVARLREITGGCVCCATQQELALALAELADATPPPARVLVETSGAASPAGVIRALARGAARERLRLDGVVTVVDASRIERALGFELALEQLAFADLVVMTHADRCAGDALDALEGRLGALAPGAPVVRARRGEIGETLASLLARRAEVLRVLPAEAEAAAHGFDAVAVSLDASLDEDRFGDWVEAALGDVEARILRVKGILAIDGVDARVVLQGVGDAVEVSLGAPWGEAPRQSRLVVVGLDLDVAALERGFLACAVAR